MKINPATRLDSLPITFWDVVFDELFCLHVPSLERRPETVQDLAQIANFNVHQTIEKLQRVVAMSKNVEIAPKDLKALLDKETATDQVFLLDVRQSCEYEICHLENSVLLQSTSLEVLMPHLRKAAHVITICHHGIRSLSAAMYLRENEVPQTQSLSGGLAAWAREIDPNMAQY